MDEQNIIPPQEMSGGATIQPQPGFAPLEIGGLFKRTWQIYKSRFWAFMGIMVLPIVVNILALFLMVFVSVGGFLLWEAGGFIIALLVSLIIWLIVVMVNIWGTVALLYAIKERKQKIGVIEAFKQGKGLLFSYTWVSR